MSIFTIAITGASGAPYALRLLQALAEGDHTLYVSISKEGLAIMRDETGLVLQGSAEAIQDALERALKASRGRIRYFDEKNLRAPIASGSHRVDAMIVIPCTMKTLSSIAHGTASNLIERAADVMIKEQRKLVLVPRETPLSAIHLRNMLTLAKLGCHMIPAMPAFYNHPKTIEDMVDFVVGRVLDSLGVKNDLSPRWGDKKK
jgi:4-hydroxy-3-polyprenylbenzoate decarboxylase